MINNFDLFLKYLENLFGWPISSIYYQHYCKIIDYSIQVVKETTSEENIRSSILEFYIENIIKKEKIVSQKKLLEIIERTYNHTLEYDSILSYSQYLYIRSTVLPYEPYLQFPMACIEWNNAFIGKDVATIISDEIYMRIKGQYTGLNIDCNWNAFGRKNYQGGEQYVLSVEAAENIFFNSKNIDDIAERIGVDASRLKNNSILLEKSSRVWLAIIPSEIVVNCRFSNINDLGANMLWMPGLRVADLGSGESPYEAVINRIEGNDINKIVFKMREF